MVGIFNGVKFLLIFSVGILDLDIRVYPQAYAIEVKITKGK